MRFEDKLNQTAKKILNVFAFIIFACLFLSILDLIEFVFACWSVMVLIGSVVLLATIDIFVKFVISYESFAIKDQKTARNNLFLALFGTFLLFLIFFVFLSPFLGVGGGRSKPRDARRLSDMRQLALAQEMFFNENGRYFTCNAASGDCGGAENNYPSTIGNYLTTTPSDPMGSATPYFGIDNVQRPDAFCYYATLENINKIEPGCDNGCGFYSATAAGNFYLKQRPILFDDCIN